jgi:hypothetical protein
MKTEYKRIKEIDKKISRAEAYVQATIEANEHYKIFSTEAKRKELLGKLRAKIVRLLEARQVAINELSAALDKELSETISRKYFCETGCEQPEPAIPGFQNYDLKAELNSL